ncbi:MAG: hypothetical protein IJC15_01865, partial [Clostridia bacterium]|nr:hypothetical protein [Clostridia bacterium]
MKTRILASVMAVMMLASMMTITSSAAAKDISSEVGFIYVFQDLENKESVIKKGNTKYEAEDYISIAPKEPGSGIRVCPEDAYFMVWYNGTTEECDVVYEINVPKAGKYEMVLVGTAVRKDDTDANSPRGIAWWLEGGEKYQVNCQPIISRSYTYDNNPETGYAVGYVYGIPLELKAGKNTLHFGHYEEWGSSGRLNFDGFYIQEFDAEPINHLETTAAP